MNEKFYEALRAIDSNYKQDYLEKVISIIEAEEIPFELNNFKAPGAIGLTVPDKVLIGLNFINKLVINAPTNTDSYYILIFVILHETAHFKRMKKHPVETELNTSVFNSFLSTVTIEEEVANRFALRMFHKIVGRRCEESDHMFKTLYHNPDAMKKLYYTMFMTIRSTGLDYFEFMNKFIIEESH